MIDTKQYYPLRKLTTFKIGGPAKSYVEVFDVEQLQEAIDAAGRSYEKILILGGGSNVLISDSGFDGMVIQYSALGVDAEKQDQDHVWMRVQAGELWDGIAAYAVKNNFWGIENLSHIPGKSGAFAIQNVGAYGQDASQVVEEVETLEIATGTKKIFSNSECKFAYRKSIFNTEQKGKFVILSVLLKLSKTPQPNLSYPDLQKALPEGTNDLAAIRSAIEKIRDAKFPYPYYPNAKGSAGSFFKNSIFSSEEFKILEKNFGRAYPDKITNLQAMRINARDPERIKVPTAFLIETCGLKGLRSGGAKINEAQPLVILNETGSASSTEVLTLANEVRDFIKNKTGLLIQFEPELVGFSEKELTQLGLA